jgi:hypothetical protein
MSEMRGHFVNRQRPAKGAKSLTYVEDLSIDWRLAARTQMAAKAVRGDEEL